MTSSLYFRVLFQASLQVSPASKSLRPILTLLLLLLLIMIMNPLTATIRMAAEATATPHMLTTG